MSYFVNFYRSYERLLRLSLDLNSTWLSMIYRILWGKCVKIGVSTKSAILLVYHTFEEGWKSNTFKLSFPSNDVCQIQGCVMNLIIS